MKVDKELLAFAEEILDEMIQAESTDEGDYELFVKHLDKVDEFGPTRFKKEVHCIRADLGDYKNREYLGALKGICRYSLMRQLTKSSSGQIDRASEPGRARTTHPFRSASLDSTTI